MSVDDGRIPRLRIAPSGLYKTRRSSRPREMSSEASIRSRVLKKDTVDMRANSSSCGHFMAMIFGDYVAGFLGLPRDGSSWSMDPFDVRFQSCQKCFIWN